MKNIVIVGNADITTDHIQFVNSEDFVIRFNDARNYDKNTGTKVDALCLTNLSTPGRLFAKYKTVQKLPFIECVKEIWFPRPSDYFPFQFWLKPFNPITFSRADYRKHIVARNKLNQKDIISFSDLLYKTCCDELDISCESTQYFPSTGYLAVKYVLQRFEHENIHITLLGFSFEGTDCHCWKNEKNNVIKLQNSKRIHWIS